MFYVGLVNLCTTNRYLGVDCWLCFYGVSVSGKVQLFEHVQERQRRNWT